MSISLLSHTHPHIFVIDISRLPINTIRLKYYRSVKTNCMRNYGDEYRGMNQT